MHMYNTGIFLLLLIIFNLYMVLNTFCHGIAEIRKFPEHFVFNFKDNLLTLKNNQISLTSFNLSTVLYCNEPSCPSSTSYAERSFLMSLV